MKRKSIFVIGSVLAAGLLVGSTFAAWAVTDKADPFNVGITPGTIADDQNDSVTLEWGQRELVKVENLGYGEENEKGPYKVGLKATTGSGEGFTGNLVLKFTFQGEVAPQLLNYLYVDVYDDAKPAPNAQNPVQPTKLLTLDKNCQGLTANKDLDVTSGQVRDVYFYIGLKGIENPAQYDALKNDVVNLQVDWNKGSQVEETTSRTYYFKDTHEEKWAEVYAYAWRNGETAEVNATWPGVKMMNVKDDIYMIDIPVEYDHIIFNNGLDEQTDDLTINPDKPYWDGTKWDDAPSSGEITEVEYYLVGTMNDWKAVEGYKLTVDPQDDNHYAISNLELAKDAALKVIDNQGHWFTSSNPWPNCGFTNDEEVNVVLSAAGTYDINFYVVPDNDNHIVPSKHDEPTPPQPEPEEVEYTISWEQTWVWDDDNVVIAWAIGGQYGTGTWVATTKAGDKSVTLTVGNDATSVVLVRFAEGTTAATADWANKNNQTEDVELDPTNLTPNAVWIEQ